MINVHMLDLRLKLARRNNSTSMNKSGSKIVVPTPVEIDVQHKTAKREGLLRVVNKIGASEMELYEAEDAELNTLEKSRGQTIVAFKNNVRAID
jgi:hypothetical protein